MTDEEKDAYDKYKALLPIDVLALDNEVLSLPQTVQEVGEWAEKAIARREKLEFETSQVESYVMNKIRCSGEKKPPETQVKSDVYLDADFLAISEALQASKLDAALWKQLHSAFFVKKTSITDTIQLVTIGYTTIQSITDRRRQALHDSRKGN